MTYELSLFIFRRDLRLKDNTALIEALKLSKRVVPCFIFDQRQISNTNEFRSDNALHFMMQSIDDLSSQLKKRNARLYLFKGQPTHIIKYLIKKIFIEAVFVNKDYTPFSINRDKDIRSLCNSSNIDFYDFDDYLLLPPDQTVKDNKEPYKVFTPFYKNCLKYSIDKPQTNRYKNYYTKKITKEIKKPTISYTPSSEYSHQGGRKGALKILSTISSFDDYAKTRDFPEINTTLLSAHLKFGTCSIREAYYKIKNDLSKNHPLLTQLYWRDFFTAIAYFFPYIFNKPFNEKFNSINWRYSRKDFERFTKGLTGFPIVDAGINQLNRTGYMHNRVRMIVASFLTKTLRIDWRWGEKYFAQQLVDYDPSVNNGNWQWAASTGCDAQPYFRIFNPWLQQKKFDKECTYIKRWVGELKNLTPKEIHNPDRQKIRGVDYPPPMINHSEQREKTLAMFKKARR